MSDDEQEDIDKLLEQALVGDDESSGETVVQDETDRGAASQDDIDALFAAVDAEDGDFIPEAGIPGNQSVEDDEVFARSIQDFIDSVPQPPVEFDAVAGAGEIDALFDAVDKEKHLADSPLVPDKMPAGSAMDNADETAIIDEPLSMLEDRRDQIDPDTDTVLEPPPIVLPSMEGGQADVDNLFDQIEKADSLDDAPPALPDTDELDELLSSLANEAREVEQVNASGSTIPANGTPDDFDMGELMRQVSASAPELPEVAKANDEAMDFAGLPIPEPMGTEESEQTPIAATEEEEDPVSPISSVATDTTVPNPPPLPAGSSPQGFSALQGAGEVEAVANQIGGLIGVLSEKARSYMQSWIAADGEVRDLRTRILTGENRQAALESEKQALSRELTDLRSKLCDLEGGRIAAEESRRTMETGYQAKIREMESQISVLTSETSNLKDELTRARNEATGVDIESRRAKFELERLRNEVDAERMERLRIQRALENREKELQALQSQSAGQASSLFIDELHRLVRRLEAELDVRTSGAHEALKLLDRLEIPETMVAVAANLRAALLQTLGADADSDDALRSLGREAAGVRGTAAVSGGADLSSFETAIATYNLSNAIDYAGELLRDVKATPSLLMRKIYGCAGLRRPEIADHLPDLARLLEGLRTVQESNDRARGAESAESELFHVQMFDFLHNLVRLKLLTRLSGEIWRLFLDLRGRFSFVTSDKQWAEYRDGMLSGQ